MFSPKYASEASPRGRGQAEEEARRSAPVQLSVLKEKIGDLKSVLTTLYPGREEQAEAVVLGLITGYPVFLQSPPGTAKTSMIETLSHLVEGANYFYYLLNRFTEPDELLGPIDILALRNGEYKRITRNKLPEAHIVFLDEIFKASSAIRNTLLDIILNKRLANGNGYVDLPMKAFYTASNEGPQDIEDAALYDRLLIRSFFEYVSEDMLEEVILKGVNLSNKPLSEIIARPVIAISEVDAVQEAVRQKAIVLAKNNTYRKTVLKVVTLLRQEGMEYSDRRLVQSFRVLAGLTIARQKTMPSQVEIADSFLYTAPMTPEHISAVEEVLEKAGLYASKEALEQLKELLNEANSLLDEFDKTKNALLLPKALDIITKINDIAKASARLPKSMVQSIESTINRYNNAKDELKAIIGQ